MKILLVSPLPPPEGGIATWTKKYMEFCRNKQIDVDIVNIALIGKRLERINRKRNLFDEIKRTSSILKELKHKLKSYKPDVVHINSSCSRFGVFRDYLCVKKCIKAKVKVFIHCRCNIEDQLGGGLPRKVFIKMIHRVTGVMVLNNTSLNYVKTVSKTPVKLVPNFIDNAMLNDNYVVNQNFERLVFVGHVQKAKGVAEIFEAAKKLPDKKIVLVGPIKEEIATLECPENVQMVGKKDMQEIKDYLDAADVFLFPTYTEGFSNALVEAMARGLPAIATGVGANEDMLEHRGGVVIPVGDAEAIVDAVKTLEPYSVRKEMSDWNRQKVKESYLIDSVMDNLFMIYRGEN